MKKIAAVAKFPPIERIIPYPRRHRRHYHDIFAPNSPLRKKIVIKIPRINPSQHVQEVVEKVEKVAFNWAKLIARIYEINPLICSCGKEIKIIGFVTNPFDIRRILNGIGWPTEIPEFDPPYDFSEKEICQLIPGTPDGFPEEAFYFLEERRGPDPPFCTILLIQRITVIHPTGLIKLKRRQPLPSVVIDHPYFKINGFQAIFIKRG